MNIQEIENTNHELGSFSNESTAAFTSSVRDHNSGEVAANKEAQEISNRGNIALVISEEAYCKHTDATIGSHFGVLEFDTVAEAFSAINSSTVKVVGKAKIEFSNVLVLGREDWDGETVVTRVGNTNYRHNRTFTLEPGEVDTGAFFLNERVDKAREINLEHWRPLTESEEEILQGQINEARGEAERENYEYEEARRLAWGKE